jgi:heme-degrading monooxygenase HmoA
MVLEVALIDVTDGSQADFEAGFRRVRHALSDSPGCRSVRMTHGVETPSRFVLLVEWDDIAAHQAFRDSAALGVWRSGIGPYFSGAPTVEHFVDLD